MPTTAGFGPFGGLGRSGVGNRPVKVVDQEADFFAEGLVSLKLGSKQPSQHGLHLRVVRRRLQPLDRGPGGWLSLQLRPQPVERLLDYRGGVFADLAGHRTGHILGQQQRDRASERAYLHPTAPTSCLRRGCTGEAVLGKATAAGWGLHLLAWAFATLFVAGFTGAVRKT